MATTTVRCPSQPSLPGNSSWPTPGESSSFALSEDSDAPERPADQTVDGSPDPSTSAPFLPSAVQWGVACAQGRRPRMEDTHVGVLDVEQLFGRTFGFSHRSAFFGVFDGHSGRSTAEFARDQLLQLLVQQPLFPSEISEALRMTYLAADEQLYQSYTHGPCSGCTALTAMIIGRQLSVAHAGDSRAVLSRRGRAVDLTHDHKPSDSSEKARVGLAGGCICGPVHDEYLCSGFCARVSSDSAPAARSASSAYDDSHLGVTRALGDFHLSRLKYRNQDDTCWQGPLIAEPEVYSCELGPDDEFLILACDGLWDVLTSQRAVEIARNSLRQQSRVSAEALQGAAQTLVDQAMEMHSTDNVTVVVVGLQSSPPPNRSGRVHRDRSQMSRVMSLGGFGALAAALAQASE